LWSRLPVGSQYFLRFAEFITSNDVELYLPFLDEEMEIISRFRDLLVVRSPVDTLRIFTDKLNQTIRLAEGGFRVPPTLTHEVVMKPNHGRGGKGVSRPQLQDDQIVQQFIDGDEYTVDVLTGRNGHFLFAVPRLRIQANGVSVIGKIVMDKEIIDLVRQVVCKFKFSGPINIQIIRERDTGKLYIIELNPRLSGSCMFTVMAGFDILDATIRLWEGKPFVPPAKIEDGMIVRRHYVEERL
jgi:carbamoyl-phosphate synthase large subunit